jgi:hypothetical protein
MRHLVGERSSNFDGFQALGRALFMRVYPSLKVYAPAFACAWEWDTSRAPSVANPGSDLKSLGNLFGMAFDR